MGQKLNSEVVDCGVSGTRIGRQKYVNCSTIWNYDFRLRVQIMDEQADKVFIFDGTNDYGHGRLVLGTVTQRTLNTFCDELRLLMEDLLAETVPSLPKP